MVVVVVYSLSRVQLFVTPWTEAHQAPPSMGFSRQEYWSGLPFPSPGGLPNPGIETRSPTLEADALTSGSSLLWSLLPVGGVGLVACQGFLVRRACVCVLVGGDGSLLSGVQ